MKKTKRRFKVCEWSQSSLTPSEILTLRTKTLNVSQSIFAELIGVSPRAITSWECSWRKPSVAVQKLIRQLQENPQLAINAIGEKK